MRPNISRLSTVTFRDMADLIVASVTGSERTTVTLDQE